MNIKRILSAVLITLCLVCTFPSVTVNAKEDNKRLTDGNYTYEMYTENSVIITDYYPTHEDTLVIPHKLNGYPVVALADGALDDAWEDNVILPDSLETIGNNVFSDDVMNVHISKSVKSIGTARVVKSFTVDAKNPYFKAVDDVLFTKDGKTLVAYPMQKEGRDYVVPDGVERIAEQAFYRAQYPSTISLPEGLKIIDKEAFKNCYNLYEASWPMTLEYIMDAAYDGCENLSAIYGYDSFYYVAPDALTNTKWYEQHPYGCVYLGGLLYSYKSSGIEPTHEWITKGTTRIGPHAFDDRGPTSVIIPDTVVSIDPTAFYYGDSIESITINGNNPYFESVDGMLFDKEKKILISIPRGAQYEVKIPDGTEMIYPMAGYNCDTIYALVIPDSVYYIGESAFESCGWLTRVECPDTIEYIGDRAFAENLCMEKIILPGENLYYVGNNVFTGCTTLKEIDIPESCSAFGASDFEDTIWYSQNSGILSINNNVLGYNSTDGKLKELIFPEDAVAIGRKAFAGTAGLKKVEIPDTIKAIGDYAFANCPNLKEIYVPATVDEIGVGAFGFKIDFDKETGDIVSFEKVDGFIIKGYTNSFAESYADANDIEFVSVGYMEPESTLLGDLDCDGKLTIKDATALQKYVAGMVGLNSQDKINADFNCDGKINVRDATAIQKRLANFE